jgi:hypothetical protein
MATTNDGIAAKMLTSAHRSFFRTDSPHATHENEHPKNNPGIIQWEIEIVSEPPLELTGPSNPTKAPINGENMAANHQALWGSSVVTWG